MSDDTYRVGQEWRRDGAAMVIISGMLLGGLLALPHLPARVPTHWNAAGQVNGWSSPLGAVLPPPVIAMGLWLLLLFLPTIDPRQRNYVAFAGLYRGIRLGLVLLMALIEALTLAGPLGHPVHMALVLPLAVAALIVFVGNSLGRVRPNYFVGIRTPWTLSDPEVWRRTHRFSAPLFVIGGLVTAAGVLLPGSWRIAAALAGVGGAALAAVVYSYVAWRRAPHPPSSPD